jgi:hypothetical protein
MAGTLQEKAQEVFEEEEKIWISLRQAFLETEDDLATLILAYAKENRAQFG